MRKHTVGSCLRNGVWLAFGGLLVTCGRTSDPGGCGPSMTEPTLGQMVEEDTSDAWREEIKQLVESAPPDSVVEAAIVYYSPVTEADRAKLNQFGAELKYEFIGIAAVVVRITVEGVAVLSTSDRVRWMSATPAALVPTCG